MADAPDQFADFFPAGQEGGGSNADQWADFNPQGPKAPKEGVPSALMRRFVNPAAEGAGAAFEGFGAQLQQEQEELRKLGVLHQPGQPIGFTRYVNETALTTAMTAAEAMLRVPNAVLEGAGAILGQNVAEMFGQGDADQARARRDMAQMVSIGGLLAGAQHPIARSEVVPGTATRVDRTIGTMPKPNDFVAASQVLAGKDNPVVIDKLLKLHDEFGINPAEVAHDAARDPDIAASILSPQPADLPRKYTATELPEDAKLDAAAGIKPPPEIVAQPELPFFAAARMVADHEADAKTIGPEGAGQAAERIAAQRDIYAETQPPEVKAALEAAAREAGVPAEGGPVRTPAEGVAVAGGPGEVVGGGGDAQSAATGIPGGVEPGAVIAGGAHAGAEGAALPGAAGRPGGPAEATTRVVRPIGLTAALPRVARTMIDNAEAYKAAAKKRREEIGGAGGGKVYTSTEAMDRARGVTPAETKQRYEDAGKSLDAMMAEREIAADEVPESVRAEAVEAITKGFDPHEALELAMNKDEREAMRDIDLHSIIAAEDLDGLGEAEKYATAEHEYDLHAEIPFGEGEGAAAIGREAAEQAGQVPPVGGAAREAGATERGAEGRPQFVMPGMEQSARQAAAAREAGGALKAGVAREEAGGLFARREQETPALPLSAAPTGEQLPPIGVSGAGQPRKNPYFTYDDRGTFAKAFDRAISGWQKTFQPELVSDKALQADPLFAKYKSATAAEKDGIIARSEAEHQFWRPTTDTERIDYMDRLERRAVMPEEWRERAERHRVMLDEADAMEHQYGSKAGYVEDYFPHIWLDPDKARGFVNTKVAQLGPKWFQKERTFDLIRDGLESGLRLKSTNPEDMVVGRLLASADMVERVKLLQSLGEVDLAKITKETPDANLLMRRGWQPIDAPNKEQWLISPDIQPLWENAVNAKGFWANEGAIGSTFRGWMAFKSVWVPLKLALSLFHPLHVMHINNMSGLTRAWGQIVKGGDFEGAVKSVTEGLYGPIQAGIPGMPYLGKELRQIWQIPEKDRTPEQRASVVLMNEGGFVPQMAEQLKINGKRALEDAMDKGAWLQAVPAAIRRGIEVMQAPFFEHWIPSLRAAAYMNDAQALLARRPELLDDPIQRMTALRTIGKSVDNRFGQMFYGGLFWDRYVKDAGIGSFLSLGWNLGFAREFGGAVFEPGFRAIDRAVNGPPSQTRATIRDAQSKLPFAISYMASAALINGAMTYAFTGTPPEGLDYMFARVGGTNPDGSPRRIANMFYLREVPMLLKHVQEQGGNVLSGTADMLWNKMTIEPIKELMQNKDYYGSDIWDVNGPVYLQAWQALKHTFADQVSPITITGARQSLLTGGQWYEAELAMMGFGPAPSYVARDATQNRIAYLYERHVAPFARPEEIAEKSRDRVDIRNEMLTAQRNNDPVALQQAANKWMAAGGSRLAMSNILMHVPGDVSMFKALPEPDQAAIMKGATPAEQEKFKPYLKSDVSLQAANLFMQAQKERQAGDTVSASATEQRFSKLITDAVSNGELTNLAAFRRSLGQQLTSRFAPDVAAIMAQPKALRGLYMQQMPGMH